MSFSQTCFLWKKTQNNHVLLPKRSQAVSHKNYTGSYSNPELGEEKSEKGREVKEINTCKNVKPGPSRRPQLKGFWRVRTVWLQRQFSPAEGKVLLLFSLPAINPFASFNLFPPNPRLSSQNSYRSSQKLTEGARPVLYKVHVSSVCSGRWSVLNNISAWKVSKASEMLKFFTSPRMPNCTMASSQ